MSIRSGCSVPDAEVFSQTEYEEVGGPQEAESWVLWLPDCAWRVLLPQRVSYR